ncbi:MAG: hypothetical protein EAX91_16565 [Candidatus Lokiarchaeota archaeon]|nr:hypothetical protein [Candidatus Lokiarchaeota archaeon]
MILGAFSNFWWLKYKILISHDFLPKTVPEPIQSRKRKINLSDLTKKTPEQDLFEKIGAISSI